MTRDLELESCLTPRGPPYKNSGVLWWLCSICRVVSIGPGRGVVRKVRPCLLEIRKCSRHSYRSQWRSLETIFEAVRVSQNVFRFVVLSCGSLRTQPPLIRFPLPRAKLEERRLRFAARNPERSANWLSEQFCIISSRVIQFWDLWCVVLPWKFFDSVFNLFLQCSMFHR